MKICITEKINTSGKVDYYNGYVVIPVGHPWHGLHYDDMNNIDTGVEITYSKSAQKGKVPGADASAWVIGFTTLCDVNIGRLLSKAGAYGELEELKSKAHMAAAFSRLVIMQHGFTA
jgi:hypothetical protein